MTVDPGLDTRRIAAAARSILACPAGVDLVVDGLDASYADVELREDRDRPLLSCPAGAPLAMAAAERRGAVLTVTSGVGRPGAPERDAIVTLSGRLDAVALDECRCCDEVRVQVALHLDLVLLARAGLLARSPEAPRLRVPLPAFTSAEHDLNRGFLQRSAEHADLCHQEELRRAIATRTQTRLGDVIGVQLADLRPDGVTLRWVDASGAHAAELRFARAAADAEELGELLRAELHAGLC